jgi:hypothetical protein
VGQLEDLLRTLKQQQKSDLDIATELKQVELSEELTRGRMNSLVTCVPGPLSTEQIYVLEARSAVLIPPPSDLPSTAPPGPATQQAMFSKAASYVNGAYAQLPSLTATKTTLRFQDNVEALAASSGIAGGAKQVVAGSGFSNPATFVHFINSTASSVSIQRGAEQPLEQKASTGWGANGMIILREPDPGLSTVFKEAQDSGTVKWLRWELINGRPAAVYAFSVPKKTSKLALNICCFPNVKQAGVATFYTATTAAALGGSGSGGGVAGNFQTSTDWHDFKTTAPYHGEFFIDPDTGIVVRLITEAELKPSDVVHQVDTRIDYGLTQAGDKTLMLPVKTYVNTEVVPHGETGASTYTTRHTLFTSEYKDYKVATGK